MFEGQIEGRKGIFVDISSCTGAPMTESQGKKGHKVNFTVDPAMPRTEKHGRGEN